MTGMGYFETDDDSDDDVFASFDSNDDDSLGGFAESDDDRWSDPDGLSEARRNWPKFKARAPAPRAPGRPLTLGKIGKVPAGVVKTPGGGSAKVTFATPPAAASSVERLQSEFKKALDAVRADMRAMDQRIEKNTATLDKKINAVDDRVVKLRKDMMAAQQQQQMSGLLPLLLSSTPKLETVTFGAAPGPGQNVVTDAKFAKQDSLLPLLLLSGGLGGGDTNGGGGMNSALLALALLK